MTATETCSPGKCVKAHPMHCCHTAVTERQVLRKGVHIVWPKCVACKRDWTKATTLIRVNAFGCMT